MVFEWFFYTFNDTLKTNLPTRMITVGVIKKYMILYYICYIVDVI